MKILTIEKSIVILMNFIFLYNIYIEAYECIVNKTFIKYVNKIPE